VTYGTVCITHCGGRRFLPFMDAVSRERYIQYNHQIINDGTAWRKSTMNRPNNAPKILGKGAIERKIPLNYIVPTTSFRPNLQCMTK